MNIIYQIPEPLLFSPLKHHLRFIREFIGIRLNGAADEAKKDLLKELKHLGTSVMDIYTGSLDVKNICDEIKKSLKLKELNEKEPFCQWAGKSVTDFKIISLSDSSEWTLKFHNNESRFVHLFPARNSPHSFRVKSNTLKSAILYYILIGKDFITGDDLNQARALLGLSPVKDPIDSEAITEMIEILRG